MYMSPIRKLISTTLTLFLFFISLDQNRIISIHLHPVGISAPVFLISRNVSKTGKQMDFLILIRL